MSFFRIRKELQLRVCNHEKLHANPCTSRKAEPFVEGEGSGEGSSTHRVQDFSLVESLQRKESFFFLLGPAMGV